MFSLESFYSVLYSNLLKPANFCYHYFYPFGSTSKDDLTDFSAMDSEQNNVFNISHWGRHKCIAWDQEPLLEHTIQEGLRYVPNLSLKRCYIIANSERSEFKNIYLREYGWQNWYYFFHGFAALDWYKNFQYYNDENFTYKKTFMSLNRLWKDDRSYRLYLVNKFKQNNLLDKGHISLHCNNFKEIENHVLNDYTKLSNHAKSNIVDNLSKQRLPIIADQFDIRGDASACGGLHDLKFNKSALWHLVSETVFYYDKRHLTEKIFKPIVSKRPFILVGATNNLAYLKEYGFQTFDKWIDESYDAITSSDDRIDAIVEQLSILCSMDKAAERRMYLEMQEVLDYNYNHFYNGSFRYKISKELVDNFQGCCKAWNQNMLRETDLIPIWNVDFEKTLSTLLR